MAAALRCALFAGTGQAQGGLDEDGYVLALGSNQRRAQGLRLAWTRLRQDYTVRDATRALPTPDTLATGPRYLNAVLRIAAEPGLTPERLRARLHAIEHEAGRVRASGLCALDIDLLARTRGTRLVEIYKPADLRREYMRRLLTALELELPASG